MLLKDKDILQNGIMTHLPIVTHGLEMPWIKLLGVLISLNGNREHILASKPIGVSRNLVELPLLNQRGKYI